MELRELLNGTKSRNRTVCWDVNENSNAKIAKKVLATFFCDWEFVRAKPERGWNIRLSEIFGTEPPARISLAEMGITEQIEFRFQTVGAWLT